MINNKNTSIYIKKIEKIIKSYLGIKNTNILRRIKWYVLNLFLNDSFLIEEFYRDEFEIRILERLIKNISSTAFPVVLDIGANIGGYSYYLSEYISLINGRCIGFEPRSDCYKRLKKNIIKQNFIAEKVALSNNIGIAELYCPTSHGNSSLIKFPEFIGCKKEKIYKTTLDAYSNKYIKYGKIIFIKIDVEGHEIEVLNGGEETIKKFEPIILCESENRHLKLQKKSVEELINYIKCIGYNAYVISYKKRELLSTEEIKIPQSKLKEEEYYYNYWLIPKRREKSIKKRLKNYIKKHCKN